MILGWLFRLWQQFALDKSTIAETRIEAFAAKSSLVARRHMSIIPLDNSKLELGMKGEDCFLSIELWKRKSLLKTCPPTRTGIELH